MHANNPETIYFAGSSFSLTQNVNKNDEKLRKSSFIVSRRSNTVSIGLGYTGPNTWPY